LLAGSTSAGTLDVTPYKTNAYYWNTKDDGSAAPKPTKAQVIWREAGITSMAEPTVTKNGNKYTLNVSNVQGYGNALVGIYDSANNLLWSYHIWKPEIDPTSDANLLEYKYTNSGTYHVMPIALGATAKVDIGPTGTATTNTLKTYGLYYQWGRKDPLGRAGALTGSTFATTYAGATGNTAFNWTNVNIKDSNLLGSNDAMDKDGKKLDDFMIDYVTKNPTQFIAVDNGFYGNSWIGKDNPNLWGNPRGYEYPRNSTLQRTILDPCPKGYRVAPADLWLAFTDNGQSRTINTNLEATWAKNILNILNLSADGTSTTFATQCGLFCCYRTDAEGMKIWQQGPADYYPAIGYRYRTTGILSAGSNGFYWCSSPSSSESPYAGRLSVASTSIETLGVHDRANAFAVRCVKAN
ncbi:MAG: hypothetical protein K2H25_02980, partial [Alistipes sp.]|nr:hypothetical protein [Alistipes sp.]